MTVRVLRRARDDLRAGIHVKYDAYYKSVSKRFPYSIYYKVDTDVVKVYAVLDNRSNPEIMQSRLEEEK